MWKSFLPFPWEWEKRLPQKVVFDLELSTDIRIAAASDSIDDALDYKAVTKRIKTIASENQFELIETLAETIAQTILVLSERLFLQVSQ